MTLRQQAYLLYGASKVLAKKYSYHTMNVADFLQDLKDADKDAAEGDKMGYATRFGGIDVSIFDPDFAREFAGMDSDVTITKDSASRLYFPEYDLPSEAQQLSMLRTDKEIGLDDGAAQERVDELEQQAWDRSAYAREHEYTDANGQRQVLLSEVKRRKVLPETA